MCKNVDGEFTVRKVTARYLFAHCLLAIPDSDMPAPAASSSDPKRSRDSAVAFSGPLPFAIDKSGVDSSIDRKERWVATLAQIYEGTAVLEGADRLRELIKGIGKDPKVDLRTCLCAAALCRAPGRFIDTGELLEVLGSKAEGNCADLPAAGEGEPVRVALIADSSMVPCRRRKDTDGVCFDPSDQLMRYARMPYNGRDGNALPQEMPQGF